MIPQSKDPFERAEVIRILEERWLLKSKQMESATALAATKKTRTSLTNPVVRNKALDKQTSKGETD